MATIERVEPAYTAWSPTAAGIATEGDEYVGRHRKTGARALSVVRMFYRGKHRRD